MKHALFASALALALPGCGNLSVLTNAHAPSLKTIYELRIAYDAAFLAPAKEYRDLPRCAPGAAFRLAAPCSDPVIIQKLQQADQRAAKALDDAKAYSKAHPGSLGVQGLFDAAQTAIGEAESILAPYVIHH